MKLDKLRTEIRSIYSEHKEKLLFHGWHHIYFVSKKSIEFAEYLNADVFIVESAALTHDLNYIVKDNSEPEEGSDMRKDVLTKCGYTNEEIQNIEDVIIQSHLANRKENASIEVMALSDADTLFKALPITPILFASNYIKENNVDIYKLANKVVSEQKPLIEKDIYFYTDIAKEKYSDWANAALKLWEKVKESIEDEDVGELIRISKEEGVI